ncbi:MAG: lysophospholipid acyltransferase family protein [Sphingopyxis sp.]
MRLCSNRPMQGEPDKARPSLLARLVKAALLALYRRHGWRAEGAIPEPRRFVIIAAPHTSNWDFLYFLGLTQDLGIAAHFIGKASLFRWPLGGFMRAMGGIAVDRSASHNVVRSMADEFARRKEFMLTIAPEGTRGHSVKWKTGFYQIALAAKVPLVVGFMDYRRRVGGLGPAIMPTGDYAADMAKVWAVYRDCTPKNLTGATKSLADILGTGS